MRLNPDLDFRGITKLVEGGLDRSYPKGVKQWLKDQQKLKAEHSEIRRRKFLEIEKETKEVTTKIKPFIRNELVTVLTEIYR